MITRTRVHSNRYGAIYRSPDGYIVEYKNVRGRPCDESTVSPTLAHAKDQLADFARTAARVEAAKAVVDSWRRAARGEFHKGALCKSGW